MNPLQNRFFLLAIALLLALPGLSQFKKIYLPDSSTFSTVGLYAAEKVIYTGIPGRELALVGEITGVDTSGVSTQPAFLLQLSNIGVPKKFSYYKDNSPNPSVRARGFDLCYDGGDNFYIAMGSSDNPILLRTNLEGEMIWAIEGNHHEYYGLICEGANMYMLGQDESFLGAHDFALHTLDSAGNSEVGSSYGTTNFDVPEAIARVPDGFIMVGSAGSSNGFTGLVVKATNSNELAWGSPYESPGKEVYMGDVVSLEEDGVLIAGWTEVLAGGGPDSVFVTHIDTSGTVQWIKNFGTDQPATMQATCIDYDPVGNQILLGGNFKAAGYNKPFAMLLDGNGDFLWARAYNDPDSSVEEMIKDVVLADNGMDFYALGRRVKVGSPFVRSIFMVQASLSDGLIPCDSSLVIGQATGELSPANVVFTEQSLNNTPFPILPGGGTMGQTVMCSVMVGLDQPLPDPVLFQVVSPTTGQLTINYDLVYATAELEVVDLQGRVIKRIAVEGGRQQATYQIDDLVSGVYLVRLKGQNWTSATRKVLVY